jgi:hypothetical protein
MNGVVLAVDGENGDVACACGGGNERASHHENLLVCKRDGLSGINRGKNCLERVSAGRSADDDVDVGMCGHRDQPFAARRRRECGNRRAERFGLFAQALAVRSGRKADHLQLVRMRTNDGERALPDRSGRPENGESLQKLYLTKT